MAVLGASAALLLARQLKNMRGEDQINGISVGLVDDNDIFRWEVALMLDEEIPLYGGGFFRARLGFPKEYPLLPPEMKFETPIFHPNGKLLSL
jgi:ubiquitin-conjugating enzyme E2 G1